MELMQTPRNEKLELHLKFLFKYLRKFAKQSRATKYTETLEYVLVEIEIFN